MASEARSYKGHRIEVVSRRRSDGLQLASVGDGESDELRVDDEPVRHGQLPDGRYYLADYAYDWREKLTDVAEGWIDYRQRVDQLRRTLETE